MFAAMLPIAAYAAPLTELHIKSDGVVIATNVVVKQKANSNYFCRMTWGENAFARLTIVTNENTKVSKANGGSATRYELQEGDVINVEGKLSGLDGALTIVATKITDFSLLKESKVLSGTISSINSTQNSFAFTDAQLGNATVYVTSTTTIQKGARTILFNELSVGDKIVSASGTYDYASKILYASAIEVNQDASIFTPRNFQGVLKSIAGTTLPTTLVVTVGGTDYAVYLPGYQ